MVYPPEDGHPSQKSYLVVGVVSLAGGGVSGSGMSDADSARTEVARRATALRLEVAATDRERKTAPIQLAHCWFHAWAGHFQC